MGNPIILYQKPDMDAEELAVASRSFTCVRSRVECRCDQAAQGTTTTLKLVIGRYSVLPRYADLVYDLGLVGARLINSLDEHKYIARFDYYEDVQNLTFESWSWDDYIRSGHAGPVVVKGRTNSRKDRFNTLMKADDRKAAIALGARLFDDQFIGPQGLIVRRYVPLKTLEVGLNGLPFANEWRIFMYRETVLAKGFYWSGAEHKEEAGMDKDALALIQQVAQRVSDKVAFYVMDIAERAEGGWVLVELNDGQMSGLSDCDPNALYSNLKWVLGA